MNILRQIPFKYNIETIKTSTLEELRDNLNYDIMSTNNYNDFQNTLCNVLDKHAPVKKKYLWANDSPFMTKYLRKMIVVNSDMYNFADNNTLSVSDISVERIIHKT